MMTDIIMVVSLSLLIYTDLKSRELLTIPLIVTLVISGMKGFENEFTANDLLLAQMPVVITLSSVTIVATLMKKSFSTIMGNGDWILLIGVGLYFGFPASFYVFQSAILLTFLWISILYCFKSKHEMEHPFGAFIAFAWIGAILVSHFNIITQML